MKIDYPLNYQEFVTFPTISVSKFLHSEIIDVYGHSMFGKGVSIIAQDPNTLEEIDLEVKNLGQAVQILQSGVVPSPVIFEIPEPYSITIEMEHTCYNQEQKEVKISTLLPITGDLSPYSGPMENAAKLAFEEVNENGGLLGTQVTIINEDSQTSEIAAVDGANKLVNINKVPAIIGAASNSISLSFIEITTGNNVVQISPSNTAPDFTTYEDNDFYFRTCPSDALQGKAMAILASDEGYTRASTLVLNNAYGVSIEAVFVEEFEKMGGEILDRVKYDPHATIFNSEIEQAVNSEPEVIILISYPETGSWILKTAYEMGVMDNTKWLLSEGLKDETLSESVGKDIDGNYIIAGFKGTAPDITVTGPAYQTFNDAYFVKYGIEPSTFTSNSYDAAAVIALAIENAGSTDETAIRDNIRVIANPPGVEVTDIGEGLLLIREGIDINYQGASSDVNFDENGDITTAYYTKWYITDNGSVEWGEPIGLE